LIFRMYMPCSDGTILNLVSNVMTIHLNMSRSLVKDWICCNMQGSLVVTVKIVEIKYKNEAMNNLYIMNA
jgi:membrane protease subunit (stomatin/prohibitin family)